MDTTQLTIKMLLDRWFALIKGIDVYSDEQLQKVIAPNKNTGVYLLGHLIAVHDDMIALMDLGDKLYPEINDVFKAPYNAAAEIPSVETLRAYWKHQNEVLTEKFNSLQANQWFEKHTAVSAEDFAKEPHRNKLNILITRTSHLAYHAGQLVLLK